MSLTESGPTGYNITVDPASPAVPVDSPEIAEIIDLVTGEVRDAKDLIGSFRYDQLIAERVRMRENLKQEKPTHICALCGTPVYIVASLHKRFFFRHIHEDGSCRAQTRDGLTEEQIRARKYHGLRESEAHKRIKRLIERSLRADTAFFPETIQSEARWTDQHDSGAWRQPDVQARSAGRTYAFEAQLSTTFLDVVVSRRLFYREQGAMLVWVLGSFSPDYRRMTTDDLLFSNNSNVFVVDEETAAISEERHCFHLRCHFRRPFRLDDSIGECWDEAIVSIHDLLEDLKNQRLFHFDYDGEIRRLNEQSHQALREELISFWLAAMNPHFDGTPENVERWRQIRAQYSVIGIGLPENPSGDSSFRAMMHAVLSATYGRPVGWQFNQLIQVAHQLAQLHTEHLLAFGYALEKSGHKSLLESQDARGKWGRKRREFRPLIQARDARYMPDMKWLPALSFVFPEVGASVKGFLERLPATAE
ncbi:DUF6035 family protein [Bradyrhizobium sp. CCBAU 53421]|uniref:DUF6035 family protein n=1 Tax=Bradyrhizobium sp. CCBAU 53421 TaxID=1325120 RepID=UPI00188B0DEF|nr:DUF6035 family protein [Bradyrhizobium sp. CCBAU 53421]QOZ36989.1 hypothetical protein XH92_40055 [Bradyrhizobium sp. CCBAU 53421]